MAGFMIEQLAQFARVHVKQLPNGVYSCPNVASGVPLSAYAMACALRLKYQPHAAVRVVCWGWVTYKDVCAREGLDWRHCIYATKPADLESAAQVVIDDSYSHNGNPRAAEMAAAVADLRAGVVRSRAAEVLL